MNHQFIVDSAGAVSTVLAIYCSVPYIASIIKGKTKPHQFSWIVFAMLNAITAVAQYLAGGHLSALVPTMFFAANLITITLSFKYGLRDTSRYDRWLFGLCLVTIIIWILTENNAVAIWLAVLIDASATAMTILKLKVHPLSEAVRPWIMAGSAYAISALTLINRPFGIVYVRPIYGFSVT